KGKVRVMAIMTGVQSAQILGPTTQKQADASREAIEDVGTQDEFASSPPSSSADSGRGGFGVGETDGGRSEVERNNGLDVIR
ncbi:cell division protein FtsZ, partial [Halobacteriales archaeon QS_4_69_225]